MKIVHAAGELYPYVKTGGLADAVGSLASMLADKGHDVAVFVPGYRTALEHRDVSRAEQRRSVISLAMKTVFTIHNIAFQGIFPMRSFALTNLPDELLGIDGLEYYGQLNLLKGGILFADRVTTVSPRYAQEIQTPEFGCGLEGVVGTRADDLVGLVNGIDTRVWNPARDRFLPARYAVHDLTGKPICRAALLKKMGMDEAFTGPVFGMICRLTEQKGLDLVLAAKDFFIGQDCRLIVLGTGEKRFENALRDLAQAHPKKIALSLKHDEEASHLIEAGADFLLMPSRFEPCGLNQMYSQAYGTIPVVTRVGGFIDTVVDVDEHPAEGTGIMFAPLIGEFVQALHRALQLHGQPERIGETIKRGMGRDFSWEKAATAYEQLYENTI